MGLATITHAQIIVPSPTHPTIQSGIDAATTGQTIRVLQGTYKENIDLKGKDVLVTSLIGPESTIIDGGGNGPTVTFASGESRKCVLEGFTITGGMGPASSTAPGGGIAIRGSSPTIRSCIVRGNLSPTYGGGIGITGSGTGRKAEPLIQDCRILNNTAGGSSGAAYASGGGISFNSSQSSSTPEFPEIRGCHFEDNVAATRGGAIFSAYGFATIVDSCTFTRNSTGSGSGLNGGSAIHFGLNSPFTITNSRFWDNTCPSPGCTIKYFNTPAGYIVNSTIAGNSGGGVAGYNSTGAYGTGTTIDVVNSILWQNAGSGEISLSGTGPAIQVSYSVVTGGYTGTGNQMADPLIANAATGNHRLMAGSPAIDAGTASPAQMPSVDFEGDPRPFGSGVDIGADERLPNDQLLYADAAVFAIGQPKAVTFAFDCPGQGNAIYLLLPSLSGTSPGLTIGSIHLPLNIDGATTLLLPILPGLIGTLDASGQAKTQVTLMGVPPAFAGAKIAWAGLLVQNFNFSSATNEEVLRFVP